MRVYLATRQEYEDRPPLGIGATVEAAKAIAQRDADRMLAALHRERVAIDWSPGEPPDGVSGSVPFGLHTRGDWEVAGFEVEA